MKPGQLLAIVTLWASTMAAPPPSHAIADAGPDNPVGVAASAPSSTPGTCDPTACANMVRDRSLERNLADICTVP